MIRLNVRLLKDENSIIVWHDYAHNPSTTRWEVLQGILDGLPVSEHKFLYAVKNTKCAIYSKRVFQTSNPKIIPSPEDVYEVTIKKH